MKRTVASLLETKGRDVYSVAPGDQVYAALQEMAEHKVGALIVLDGTSLVGVISERDFAREMLTADGGPRDMLVSDIMTKDVHTVSPDSTVTECMGMMTDKRIRHLPVVDEAGEVLGVISIGDVVSVVITFQESLIADLERYITG